MYSLLPQVVDLQGLRGGNDDEIQVDLVAISFVVLFEKRGLTMNTNLSYQDMLTLHVLGALGVCRFKEAVILSGYRAYKYGAKKLKELEDNKFIASAYIDRRKCIFLTGKGYKAIGKQKAGYKINNTTLHDVEVATIATWLYLTKGISYADLLTDRQMKYLLVGSNIHRPDIVLESVCYEFEKSIKDKKRLLEILKENRKYEKQVWIVREKFLENRIKRFAQDNIIQNVEVIMLDTIKEYVDGADYFTNEVRAEAVLGERNIELVKRGTNNIMDKYNTGGWEDV